jgi:hypothetical protein
VRGREAAQPIAATEATDHAQGCLPAAMLTGKLLSLC